MNWRTRARLFAVLSLIAVSTSDGSILMRLTDETDRHNLMRWGTEIADDVVEASLCSAPTYDPSIDACVLRLLPTSSLLGQVEADDTLTVRVSGILRNRMGQLEIAPGDTILTYVVSCDPKDTAVLDPSLFWAKRGANYLAINPLGSTGDYATLVDTLRSFVDGFGVSSLFANAQVVMTGTVSSVENAGRNNSDTYRHGSFRVMVESIQKDQSEATVTDTVTVFIPAPAAWLSNGALPKVEVGDRSVLFLDETESGFQMCCGLRSKWDILGADAVVSKRVPPCGKIGTIVSRPLTFFQGGGEGDFR